MARCFMLAELRRKPRDRLSLRRNLNSSSLTDSTNIKELISMSRILMTLLMMRDSVKKFEQLKLDRLNKYQGVNLYVK